MIEETDQQLDNGAEFIFIFKCSSIHGFVSSSHEGCVCVVNIEAILKIPFFSPLEMIALAL